MVSSSPRFFRPRSSFRDNDDRLVPGVSRCHRRNDCSSSSPKPQQELLKNSPSNSCHRGVVQYRRSGQYYRYISSQPKPNVLFGWKNSDDLDPSVEFEDRELDASEMEEKQWLEEQTRSDYEAMEMEMETEGNDEDSKSKDELVRLSEDNATTRSSETPHTLLPEEAAHKISISTATKRSLNQALRKLYHSSVCNVRRRLSNEDEDNDLSLALQEPRTEDDREDPMVVTLPPTNVRSSSPVSVTRLIPDEQKRKQHPRAIESSISSGKKKKDDCYYYAIETTAPTQFYSEDLVEDTDKTSGSGGGDGSAGTHSYENDIEAAIYIASSSNPIDAVAAVDASIFPTNPNRKRNYSGAFGDD